MSGVETAIDNTIDIEGKAKKFLAEYRVTTISLVGENALGVPVTKLKGNKKVEGSNLSTKIEKAKALDAEAEAAALIESAEAAKLLETEVVAEVAETIVEVVSASVEAISDAITEAGEKTEKAKNFTIEEVTDASTKALKTVAKLAKEIQEASPDADVWEVMEIIWHVVYTIEDAMWWENEKLYRDAWNEVNEKVNKAKALKVEAAEKAEADEKAETAKVNKAKSVEHLTAGNYKLAIKSLEDSDPALATALKFTFAAQEDENEKILKEKQKIVRQKSLDEAAVLFKRIATDDISTDNIADALMGIQGTTFHDVLSKALTQAGAAVSLQTIAPDIGQAEEQQFVGEGEYVKNRAKALVKDNADNGDGNLNLCTARADVRESAEYNELYNTK